jgi:hypothetical protein
VRTVDVADFQPFFVANHQKSDFKHIQTGSKTLPHVECYGSTVHLDTYVLIDVVLSMTTLDRSSLKKWAYGISEILLANLIQYNVNAHNARTLSSINIPT